jgi:eukaryotic-like serine/threonine-protein kinase
VWAENLRVTGDNTVTATVVFLERDGTTTREPYRFVIGTQNGRQVIESFNRL